MSISNIKNFYQSTNMQTNNMPVQKQKEVEKHEKQVKEQTQQENTNVENNKKEQEQVTISKAAMDKLKNHQNEEIRQDKVDELKKKIASGEFQVNSNKVADKLLQQYQKISML